ncbi:MAG: hypothetical protein BroJett011_43140 [Chloroflexota bacterium]|nr:MAG: hypothetical protein BroJett011_43140 [Chloroflexota bacterium]
MSARPGNSALERSLKPGHFLYWQGQRYRLLPGDEADPLTLQLENIVTLECQAVRVEELLLPQGTALAEPVFAPSLAALQIELERRFPPPEPVNPNGLPKQLRHKAEHIVSVVETVERLVTAEAGRALLHRGKGKFLCTPAIERACGQLAEPVSLATYYNYRRLYQKWQGDQNQIAAALHRSSFNQTRLSQAQLHFVDSHILRFYARSRPFRPRPLTLYEIMQSTWKRTQGLWPDPKLSGGQVPPELTEALLDPRLPMPAILANPEKAGLLKSLELPSRSWVYQYLRWFEHQPEQGQAVMTARYGQDRWEREQLVFDTFVSQAMLPLQYVLADHWLVDVFTVDEATRSQLQRLWLTLLVDAFSRSVLGMALLYEAPCIESIQSALRHAIWPKTSHRTLRIEGEWISYGIPQQLSLDNAWAHHASSLENLARVISQGGRYNSIDLIFRPPYKGRYGALIERLFGNLSSQVKERLPGAIRSNEPRALRQATQEACLLYEDLYRFFQELIVRYQHTPHGELGGLTPHQKWLEGLHFGPPLVPPLTPATEQLFWRMSPETRVITNKGISAFGMHYWSPDLSGVQRVGWDGQPIRYNFSYEPADISRLALFRDGRRLSVVYAKELRLADGSTRPISLWEQQLAKALAQSKDYNTRDWLRYIHELEDLYQRRLAERKRVHRLMQRLTTASVEVQPIETAPAQVVSHETGPSYTEWLASFVDDEPFGSNEKEMSE